MPRELITTVLPRERFQRVFVRRPPGNRRGFLAAPALTRYRDPDAVGQALSDRRSEALIDLRPFRQARSKSKRRAERTAVGLFGIREAAAQDSC